MKNFAETIADIKKLEEAWKEPIQETENNRKLRQYDVDIDAGKEMGVLKDDDCFIPIRSINSNIRREQPSYLSYLTQSRRVAVFTDVNNPSRPTDRIERAFTDGMTYEGWWMSIFKCLDGGQTHGWDAVEIEHDATKPLQVSISHVGHDCLLFPTDTQIDSYQNSALYVRKYKFTKSKLEEFVTKFGFNAEQVNLLLESEFKDGDKTTSSQKGSVTVYKYYCREAGVIYVAWGDLSSKTTDWLKAPEPLFLNRMEPSQVTELTIQLVNGLPMEVPTQRTEWKPIYESNYPYRFFIYSQSEEKEIVRCKGRAFEDQPAQEAQTSLWSSFVSGSVRATNVFGSPRNPTASGASIKQLDLQIEHSRLFNNPVDFYTMPSPPTSMIDAAGRLDSQKQNEIGQLNYSVLTRKDTEKTATEIQSAREQASLLSTVQVTQFSLFLQSVYSFAWLLAQNYALNPNTGVKFSGVSLEEVSALYTVKPAGDTDVIQRAEKLSRMQQMWPIMSATNIATDFLADMLKIAFPDDAERYIAKMLANNQQVATINGLSETLKAIVLDDSGKLKPEFVNYGQQLNQLLTNATNSVQTNAQPQGR